ncbi:MAG TPA: lipoprotein [Xanthomonadaceae bacterium]|jgi:predicted small lipoprotein YifL
MKTTSRLLLLAAASTVALAACGNKGQLVMPDKAGSPAGAKPATTPDRPPNNGSGSPATPDVLASPASPAG